MLLLLVSTTTVTATAVIVVAAALTLVFNFGIFFSNDDILGNFNSIGSTSKVYAQQSIAETNKIALASSSAQFSPLTNAIYNQLKVIVNYDTQDVSLINTRINGVMQVSLLNGSLVRMSSFPNGFIVNQTGTIQFATSFADKTIQNVKADIILTGLDKSTPLSNIITTNVALNNTGPLL
jgi:hypothetical protein